MNSIVGSIEAEYRRYKALGEGVIAQLQESELSAPGRGDAWRFLSIPPGGSDAYNQQPTLERPATHATTLNRRTSEEE